jgi:transposase InsO family protein
VSRFRFVADHRAAYGVKRLCRIAGCSRSGFYDWARRPPSRHMREDERLSALVDQIHERSRRTYGAPRIHAELRRLGERCARKRVARLMRERGWVGVHTRRRRRAGRPDVAPAPDLVRRAFSPARRDAVWAADISQFWTGEGWLHLAGVMDLHSRRVVGWAMGPSPDADLVIDALLMAFCRRRPDRRLIHHSDRGSAYTSLALSRRLAELGIAASFGSTGDCFDNAAVEAFFATLKRELRWIHGERTWPNRILLRSALFDYIEGFYNPSRIQRRLGYRSPADYERTGAMA